MFGPFLRCRRVYLLQRLLTGRLSAMPLYAVALLVLAGGIFLSFSRAAWGLFAASSLLLVAGLFLQSASGAFRLRIVVMALVADPVPRRGRWWSRCRSRQVRELFTPRAQLVQDYDGARLGRFDRYGIGFLLAMEHPLGIGPLVFGKIYGEDTHNIWLKALLDYGWLGFAAYVSADRLDARGRLPHPASATGPGSPTCSSPMSSSSAMWPRQRHRHRPLAPFLSAARHDLGRHRTGIPSPAAPQPSRTSHFGLNQRSAGPS